MIRNRLSQPLTLVSALLLGAAIVGAVASDPASAAAPSVQPAATTNRIHIMSAGVYGYRAGETLGRFEWDAVERAIRKECQGKASCIVTASTEWLRARDSAYSDPAPNMPKRAEIRYRCADAASGAYEFLSDGQSKTLSCGA